MATTDRIYAALDGFRIELPSWGFANTGTRFGKFLQPAAASTLEEKFSDAGQVHALTGVCPTVALHVLWDLPEGIRSAADIARLSQRYGVRAGSINPNLFQDQEYKHGSFGNPDPAVRDRAKRQFQPASLGLAHQKFLEQQCTRADRLGVIVRAQRRQFIAQSEQTTRLQAHNRHAAHGERGVGVHQPRQLFACLIDEPCGEERAPTTKGPAAVSGLRNVNAIAAFDQYAQRCIEVFAFVGTIEGIGE